MRHQLARVVFVACLAAGFAAAQAPISVRTFETSDLSAESLTRSWSVPRFDPAALPQDPDYSMRGMFQQAHGEFMAGRGRYEPMASVHASLLPDASIRHEPGAFDLFTYGFDASVPLVLSTEGYLLAGAYYDSRIYEFTPATTLGDETVIGAGLKLGFGWFLDENLLLEVETRPGAFTDADGGLHHQDFDFPSHALVTYRAADFLYWKAGVRYNQIFEDAPWLPYLGVSWNITGMITPPGSDYGSDSWRLDVMLPEYFELSYWPTGDTGFTFGADITGAEYHVRTSRVTGNQRANLRVQEVTTYLGMVHRFSDLFSIDVKGGAVVAGDYDLTNGAAGFNRVEGSLESGLFAHVSFGIDW